MPPVENPSPDTGASDTPVASPAPSSTPAPPAPAGPAPAPKPENRREVITEALKNAPQRGGHAQSQPRSPQGQFAGPPKAPVAPVAATPPAPRPAMPSTLKKELQPHWEAAPMELLHAFIEREENSRKGIEPLKSAQQQLMELLNEFKPYEPLLRAENATPKAAIANLMKTAAILRTGTPEQKAWAAASTMRQFGIPLEAVQALLSGQAPAPQAAAADPQVTALTQQVQQLTSHQQQQEEARVQSAIRKFAADPANKHFEAVSDRMALLLQTPQVLGTDVESMSEDDKLKAAYDAAIRLHPEIHQQVLAERQARDKADAEAREAEQLAKARNAAVQVSGAPSSGPAPKPNAKDRRAVIANALARHR